MSVQEIECKNCGARLERREDGLYACPQCGSVFKDEPAVGDTVIHQNISNHNETYVKNFYGGAVTSEKTRERIESYYGLILEAMSHERYAEARGYAVRIVNLDPDEGDARAIKRYLDHCKKENGRYGTLGFAESLAVLTDEDLLGRTPSERPFFLQIFVDELTRGSNNYYYYFRDLEAGMQTLDKLQEKLSEIADDGEAFAEFKEKIAAWDKKMREDHAANIRREQELNAERLRHEQEQEAERLRKEKRKKHIIAGIVIGLPVLFIAIGLMVYFASVILVLTI